MKRLLLLGAVIAATVSAKAADYDTLVVRNVRQVEIITGDSLQKIKLSGKEGDSKYSYENTIQLVDSNYTSATTINRERWDLSIGLKSKNGKKHHNVISSHMGIGLCQGADADPNADISLGNSWEIFLTIAQWDRYDRNYNNWYSIGFGVDWRNYRLEGRNRFYKTDDGNVIITAYPEGADPKFSRIKVFSLNIPILFGHKFNKGLALSVGPVLNFNTHASIKTRYWDADGRKQHYTAKHIHQRPFTVDLMAVARLLNIQIYGKYSPMDTMNPSYASGLNKSDGARFQSVSFGVYL